jgi:hypothetical protein
MGGREPLSSNESLVTSAGGHSNDQPRLNMDRPLPNTYWVIPGRLLAGEYPLGDGDADARLRLALLRGAGIDYFVDLTEEGERPAYRHLLPTHSQHLRSAIADTWVPNNAAQMQQILSDIRAALAGGRCVYVHCRAGIGRTGLVVGCFLAEEGGNGKAALKLLNRLWRQSERAKTWPKVPQTVEQANYIRQWPKRR